MLRTCNQLLRRLSKVWLSRMLIFSSIFYHLSQLYFLIFQLDSCVPFWSFPPVITLKNLDDFFLNFKNLINFLYTLVSYCLLPLRSTERSCTCLYWFWSKLKTLLLLAIDTRNFAFFYFPIEHYYLGSSPVLLLDD